MSDWSQELTRRIGEEVRKQRGERTALWLSDETAKRGMRVSRSSISELENGKRRSISVAEWLILAAALQVPPVLLLYPDYPDGNTEFLPEVETLAHRAADWVSGDAVYPSVPGEEGPPVVPIAHFAVGRVRERENLPNEAMHQLAKKDVEAPESFMNMLFGKIDHLNQELAKSGYVVGPQWNRNPDGQG